VAGPQYRSGMDGDRHRSKRIEDSRNLRARDAAASPVDCGTRRSRRRMRRRSSLTISAVNVLSGTGEPRRRMIRELASHSAVGGPANPGSGRQVSKTDYGGLELWLLQSRLVLLGHAYHELVIRRSSGRPGQRGLSSQPDEETSRMPGRLCGNECPTANCCWQLPPGRRRQSLRKCSWQTPSARFRWAARLPVECCRLLQTAAGA
jgi:hypothetical protein